MHMVDKQEQVAALIAATRAGDRTAFSALLGVYRPLILSQVGRFFRAGPEWDELYQDASLALYRAALCYRSDGGVTFGSYARVCIGNALVSAYRKLRAPEALPLDEALLSDDAEAEDPESRMIAAEETSGLYRAALACLSPYELRVFFLYIRGCTPREIAPEVGRTEKSVSNAIGRMLVKLRGQLK